LVLDPPQGQQGVTLKIIAAILAFVALAVVALAVWVRAAPVEPERWHVDPLRASSPGDSGWLLRDDGDARPPRLDGSAEEVLTRLDEVAAAEPRTRRIAGSIEEGRITYESRSRLWRFPDYTTVTVVEESGEAVPVLLGRARFGRSDLGVNRARIERWMAALT
jgi:uncharacterized protein (DUF1499 family)